MGSEESKMADARTCFVMGPYSFQVAGSGIQLPNIPDVTIVNPKLSFGQHTLTVCCDIAYTGPTKELH